MDRLTTSTIADVARRRGLLTAALGFALLDTRGKPAPADVQMVRRWLDNWTGLWHVVTGMQRQGYRLSLTDIDGEVWRATFGRAPLLSSAGFGTGTTPWRALQGAALNEIRTLYGDRNREFLETLQLVRAITQEMEASSLQIAA